MNKLNTIVFEDGQGKLMDEDGNELMEVDEMVVEVKGLTSLSDYLQAQLRHSMVTIEDGVKDENNTGNTTKITKTKKKAYTAYSDIDKYNFILHMVAKCPNKVAPVARKYNINLRTGQRWWNKYKEDPDSFFIPKERGNHKILNEEHKKFLINYSTTTLLQSLNKQWTVSLNNLRDWKLLNQQFTILSRMIWALLSKSTIPLFKTNR